jgi:transposase
MTGSACLSTPSGWSGAAFIWPSPADGVVAISLAQLAYMLDGIDWRNPVRTWRPEVAG